MYVLCVCVFVCVYRQTAVHMLVLVCVHVCMYYVCVCVFVGKSLYTCWYLCVYMYVLCVCVFVCVYRQTAVYMLVLVCVHVCIMCVCVYVCIGKPLYTCWYLNMPESSTSWSQTSRYSDKTSKAVVLERFKSTEKKSTVASLFLHGASS
jgi:hypothetical protein